MGSIKKIQIPIKEEMAKFEATFKASIKSKVLLLNIITNYILKRKRKQTRQLFVFLAAKLNGTITNDTYTAASLIELLHTATLIHDDVVDESYERRSLFSINALWHSKIAVLMGDYLLSKGLLLSVENKAFDLLEIVSGAVKEMSEGELLQIQRLRNMNITTEQYLEIIRKKNATLIAACTASGAKSVGCDTETVKNMQLFGEYIGLSFQLKDDLLDFKPLGILGKSSGNNTKEKKLTLPLIYSFEHSSKSEKNHVINVINSTVKHSEKTKIVLEFVTQKGGIDYASRMMFDLRDKALKILVSYSDSEVKSSLIKLVNFMIERKN